MEDPAEEQRHEQNAILFTLGCAFLVGVVVLLGVLVWIAGRGSG